MAIHKLVSEDPTLRVATDQETGQTILAGMGELHLEIIVDRMKREFNVGANVGKPQVAYRETIRQDGRIRLHAQEADRRQRSIRRVKLRVEPIRTRNSSSRTKSRAAKFRRNSFRPSRRASLRRSRAACSPAIPINNIKVAVFDGAYHEVDSSEMAFKICSSICVKEACRKAKPVLLEPVMRVEVTVPEEYMGSVNGDLISRRGRLEGTEIRAARTSSRRWCRCPKCSVTQLSSGRGHRGAPASQCTSDSTKKCQRIIAEENRARVQGKVTR